MPTPTNRTQENKSQSASSAVSQKKGSGRPSFQFVDNRPEAIAQRKLREIAGNSSQVSQLRTFQGMANKSAQAKQVSQLQAQANGHLSQQQPVVQKKENNTGLPDKLKTGIEKLSGYSMDDVKVHRNSDKPATLQAHAYAQGTDIHLAPGQEKHLPHEAWHVVQQKQGRVKPTKQMKGDVNINDDTGLEREADVMGGKAIQSKLKEEELITDKSTNNKNFSGQKEKKLKKGEKTQNVSQGVFDLVGDIYDLNEEGELDALLNGIAMEQHRAILIDALARPEGQRLLEMGRERSTFDLIELLMNIQSDAEYIAYLGGVKGHTFQEFDDQAMNAPDKYGWETNKHEGMLADFPAHSVMPFEDRYLTKAEFEASYNRQYGLWQQAYQANSQYYAQVGAEGSAPGRNMIVDRYSWRDIEAIHNAKTGGGLEHRTAVSGSGRAESNKWYTVYDLLINNPKATFNYHVGVLNNELPYRKTKNLNTEYKVQTYHYAVNFTNGSGDQLNNNREFKIRRASDKRVISRGQTGTSGIFKTPFDCEINFQDFGNFWLKIDGSSRYGLPGGYAVDFNKR